MIQTKNTVSLIGSPGTIIEQLSLLPRQTRQADRFPEWFVWFLLDTRHIHAKLALEHGSNGCLEQRAEL